MQLVNQPCALCRARIARENEARSCPKCGAAVHHVCAERAKAAKASGCCRACGAPSTKMDPPPARGTNSRGATPPRGYRTVLAGVALMAGGILGSMCFFGAAGEWQLPAAGGAIFFGAVLVAVGFLQSARR